MRVVLISRYPRVDAAGWKRELAQSLLDRGIDLALLYSRSSMADQARAGLKEFGLDAPRRLIAARSTPAQAGPTGSLAAWARRQGVPVRLHRRLGDREAAESMRALAPDLVLLTGADIVPATLLAIPRLGTLNSHYGLMPRYRGMNATEWSIYNDDPVGVSVHFVTPGIDTGDVVAEERIEILPGDDLERLRLRHQRAAARLLDGAVESIAAGTVSAVAQDLSKGRQHYRMHPLLRGRVEAKLAAGAYGTRDSSR